MTLIYDCFERFIFQNKWSALCAGIIFLLNKKPVFTFTCTVHASFIVEQGSDNLMFFAYRAIS